MVRPIRLVTFDALHTIITPRKPIHVQYSQVISPYVGELPPEKIRESFKVALKAVQKENPSYNSSAETWWREVIRRTTIGAGAEEESLDPHLTEITMKLMKRFSSGEGYKAFDDAIPTVRRIHNEFGIKTAVISNGDGRIRGDKFIHYSRNHKFDQNTAGSVLTDLGFPNTIDPIVLSEEVGVEKPSRKIFAQTLQNLNRTADLEHDMIQPAHGLHIGDELVCDYRGALEAGWNGLLLRRLGKEGEHEHKEPGENLEHVEVIHDLDGIIEWLKEKK